ncbi:mediator of RNA polymerase II transcription subunit 15-like [Temnothorax curvispinosus]|uniref:Mediator of RNA polymerase II transcription subunit 15-like n=1 Tax=Temnothorax curvispinosus TaxID=300111 RepID=A0A6J1QY64_9HYME|nr:mediator of RNA polymerase II transcription subunit 15-like [Temnothorax curvispinosus]
MERQRLQDMSIGELQEEARKYGLNPPGDSARCIDLIMSHLEKHGPTDLLDQKRETRAAAKSKTVQSTSAATTGSSDLAQICALMAEQMRVQQQESRERQEFQKKQMRVQQQESRERLEFQRKQARSQQEQQRQSQLMMQQMLELVNLSREDSQSRMRDFLSSDNGVPVTLGASVIRRQPISSVATAHAVKMLTGQIPEFAGTDEDNVKIWIQTGERIAQIHAVTEDVLLWQFLED